MKHTYIEVHEKSALLNILRKKTTTTITVTFKLNSDDECLAYISKSEAIRLVNSLSDEIVLDVILVNNVHVMFG